MRILKEREHGVSITYAHSFTWKDDKNAGFSFDCDKNGNVFEMHPIGFENFKKCQNGTFDVIDEGIIEYRHKYILSAIGKCDDCHKKIELYSNDNECQCGAIYNMSGQRLAPRHFWGEETGESF